MPSVFRLRSQLNKKKSCTVVLVCRNYIMLLCYITLVNANRGQQTEGVCLGSSSQEGAREQKTVCVHVCGWKCGQGPWCRCLVLVQVLFVHLLRPLQLPLFYPHNISMLQGTEEARIEVGSAVVTYVRCATFVVLPEG